MKKKVLQLENKLLDCDKNKQFLEQEIQDL
jgi:hypothetical protein